MILEPILKENKMVELPPLSLNSMTKPELVEFIPRLLNITNASVPATPKPTCNTFKPEWWPVDVPWVTPSAEDHENQFPGSDVGSADKLRSVVKACYEYMGHKDLLSKSEQNTVLTSLAMNSEVMTVESDSSDASDTEVIDVYVCFYCDRWFGGKNGKVELEKHVITHMDNPLVNKPSTNPNEQNNGNPFRDTGGNFKSPVKPKPSVPRPVETKARKSKMLPNQGGPLMKKPKMTLPRPAETERRTFLPRKPKIWPEVPLWKRKDLPCDSGVNQSDFMKSFGLLTNKQARKVALQAKSDVDIDCEIGAVEEVDSRPLTSPRTPKSLMSQLSRDGESSSKKRLSFSVPEDVSDGESAEPAQQTCNVQGALLNIPFSSLLGKRVKKHIKPDSSACTIKDIEEHCSTVVRNEFLDKLRFRSSDYPITYRRKRKHCSKYCHDYNFSKADKKEFMRRVQTGLNKRSRQMMRQLNRCKVVLQRVSKEEITFWMEKKGRSGAMWIDDDISIVQVEPPPMPEKPQKYLSGHNQNFQNRPTHIMGPRCRQPNVLASRMPNMNAMRGNSHIHIQPRPPMPQFLVKKVEKQFNGHQSSKLVYVPINKMPPNPHKRIESHSAPQPLRMWGHQSMVVDRRPIGPKSISRRKQHFQNVRCELDGDGMSSHRVMPSSSEDQRLKHQRSPQAGTSCQQRVDNSRPQKQMFMSASGGFVTTVSPKAAKTFGSAVPAQHPQMQRNFTAQPRQAIESHQNRYSVTPMNTPIMRPTPNVPVKPMSVYRDVSGVYKTNNVFTPSNAPVKIQSQQVRLPKPPVIDEVIYIDDDDD